LSALRLVFLADSHLGFDSPQRPRVKRRRRGDDFFSNYLRALDCADRDNVDAVIHGGDLFHRSEASFDLASRAAAPLLSLAERGIDVLIVPGNHERSRLPRPLLFVHPRVHVFDRPKTIVLSKRGLRLALSGAPFFRRCGEEIAATLARSRWREAEADVRLLCLHQALEGARVGAHNFTFHRGHDVIAREQIPSTFRAVLSGHIHRHQILGGDPHPPVLYCGSVERTAFAERHEQKGFMRIDLGKEQISWRFIALPARPMRMIDTSALPQSKSSQARYLRQRIAALEADAIVALRGQVEARILLSASEIRALGPKTMNFALARSR